MGGHVFISYSHARDQSYVELLAAFLQRAGIPVWFDREIVTGERWDHVIRERIETCSAFIVIMSHAADESRWVAREVNQAEALGKPLLPLLVEGSVLFRLSDTQYEDVTGGQMPSAAFVARLAALATPERHDPSQAAAVAVTKTPPPAAPAQQAAVTPSTAAVPSPAQRAPGIDINRPITVTAPVRPPAQALLVSELGQASLSLIWAVIAITTMVTSWFSFWGLVAVLAGLTGLVMSQIGVDDENETFIGTGFLLCLVSAIVHLVGLISANGAAMVYQGIALATLIGAYLFNFFRSAMKEQQEKATIVFNREETVAGQVHDRRWYGRNRLDEAGGHLFDALADLPSARFVSLDSDDHPLETAVVCGRHVLFVAFADWPPGVYSQQGSTALDVRRDGRTYQHGIDDLTLIREKLEPWLALAPSARVLVVTGAERGKGEGVVIQPSGEHRIRLTAASTFVADATGLLRDAAYEVDVPLLTGVAAWGGHLGEK